MQNWYTRTSLPLFFGGAISAMYIGTATETPPVPIPPMNRIHARTCGPSTFPPGVTAQPAADTKNRMPIHTSVGLRPRMSHIFPAASAPNTVPISAPAITSPCQNGASANSFCTAWSHPDITPASKPNSSPPRETAQTIQ